MDSKMLPDETGENKRVITVALDGFASNWDMVRQLIRLSQSEIEPYIGYIKLNDALHSNVPGPEVLSLLRANLDEHGCENIKIFWDMKIGDVSATVINVANKYKATGVKIDILTVSGLCSADTFAKLKGVLPDTQLALFSVPTDMSEKECINRYGQSARLKIAADIENISRIYTTEILHKQTLGRDTPILEHPFEWVVCSAQELQYLKQAFPKLKFIVPGIRDPWMGEDHQKRIIGVKEALLQGAGTVVMGAQVLKGNPGKDVSAEESRRLTMVQIDEAVKFLNDNITMPPLDIHLATEENLKPMDIIHACNAYYEGPTDGQGNFSGPLVGLAGTYDDNGAAKNFVSNVYCNFAKVEEHPAQLKKFAQLIIGGLRKQGFNPKGDSWKVLGAPMGGILLAGQLGALLNIKTVFAEKKVTKLAEPKEGKKEESDQVIDRHEILPGENIILVEDVCNNFSTTKKIKEEIEAKGATLAVIVCAINRSGMDQWEGIPVIRATDMQAEQFRQDDPKVSQLIKDEKIVWKPKSEWEKLMEAMNK